MHLDLPCARRTSFDMMLLVREFGQSMTACLQLHDLYPSYISETFHQEVLLTLRLGADLVFAVETLLKPKLGLSVQQCIMTLSPFQAGF